MLTRGWGALLLLVTALTVAMITGRELLFTVSYLLAGLILISFLATWSNLYGIRITRNTKTHFSQVGKPAIEDFTLANLSPLPKLWLEVRDHSTLPNHRAGRAISSLRGRGTSMWNVRTQCVRRGRFTLGPLSLSSEDPFGLFKFKRRIAGETSIVIYPATMEIPHFPLQFGDLPGGDAMRRRTHHVTDNVAGVREYSYGDSFHRIHWPSTARTGRLIVKEFELDPTTDVWLYLDMDRGVHVASPWAQEQEHRGPALLWADRPRLTSSTEEYTVTVAASLANHLLSQGRSVGLVAYGQTREVVQADRGGRQLTKLLETLAVLEAQGNLPFHQILSAEAERLPRGATVIGITPTAELDWIRSSRDLARRGIRMVGILIVANTFTRAPDQSPAIAELRRSEIPAFIVNRGDDIGAALAAPSMGTSPRLHTRISDRTHLG